MVDPRADSPVLLTPIKTGEGQSLQLELAAIVLGLNVNSDVSHVINMKTMGLPLSWINSFVLQEI